MNALVTTADLRQLLADEPRLVVLDVRYRMGSPEWGREQYAAGHLPGAHFVDLDGELAAPLAAHEPAALAAGDARPGTHPGGRHPLPSTEQLAALAERVGLRHDSVVVVLDQRTSLASARAWWVLRDAGLVDVRVLDGGHAAWLADGGEVTTDVPAAIAGSFVPRPGQWPRLDTDQIGDHLAAGHQLVDVRAAVRFAGAQEPVDPVAGHIPGAVNLPATELFAEDGRLLPVDQLRERLAGLAAGDAFSCGSGVTASQALWAAEVAGIEGLQLHPGSFSDWISSTERPVACEPVHD